jgi:hypothetical protein
MSNRGPRWCLRCRDAQWASLVGHEGDRERDRAPHLAGPSDCGRAAEGPARRLGPGLTGRFATPRRRRRSQRARPGRAACDWLGLPDISRAALCQSSGAPVSRPGSTPAPSPSQLRNGVAHAHRGGGDCDLAQSGVCGHLCVWQNAEPGATRRWAPAAASAALLPVEGDRAQPLPFLHYVEDI